MLSLLRLPATEQTRRRATEGTVSNREHTHVRHTMATSQYSCEEWWLGDSTCCVACTCSLHGVCCGHFRSPMLHPFTLPIVRRQSGFHTLTFAHWHPAPLRPLESSQKAWDAPLLARTLCSVDEAAASPLDRARLLAAKAAHGSELIFALPITAFGLRLNIETIRVTIGLWLGLSLCEPHPCPCGSVVDASGLHGLSCKRSAGRSTRHQQLNDVIWRALRRAAIPAVKEPSGLISGSNVRPDGLTLILWQGRRCLAWDATVVDTLAMSYLSTSSTDVASAAKVATERRTVKYSALSSSHICIPITVDTLGPIN